MKLSTSDIKEFIKTESNNLDSHLSLRVMAILEYFSNEELSESEEIDIFDLMVKLILRSDSEPAEVIANLLVP